MLNRLHLRNFTVFEDADFEFGPGLNVIVGANGTGKSHVLKVGYTRLFNISASTKTSGWGFPEQQFSVSKQHSDFLNSIDKLERVFQSQLKTRDLVKHNMLSDRFEIESSIVSEKEQLSDKLIIPFDNNKSSIYDAEPSTLNSEFINPVFIPAKEALTMGWLLPLYDRREIPIDETYPDLLRLLMGPPLRQPEPAHIVAHLQQLIGGKVEEEGGHFYLSTPDQPRLEMNLVAEGVRKFATLYKLLANGTLTPETTLFWDEPEANLNPALLKEMAAVLTELAKAGFQIIMATHSLFLLKELHILAQRKKQPVKYFALYADESGATQVETKDDFIQLEHVAALDAELTQTFDFEAALDDEYAGNS